MATLKVCDWQGCTTTGQTGKQLVRHRETVTFPNGKHAFRGMVCLFDLCHEHVKKAEKWAVDVNRRADPQTNFQDPHTHKISPEIPDGPAS